MASATAAGTWDPAGPSRNAEVLEASAGKRARTAWTSSTRRAYAGVSSNSGLPQPIGRSVMSSPAAENSERHSSRVRAPVP